MGSVLAQLTDGWIRVGVAFVVVVEVVGVVEEKLRQERVWRHGRDPKR